MSTGAPSGTRAVGLNGDCTPVMRTLLLSQDGRTLYSPGPFLHAESFSNISSALPLPMITASGARLHGESSLYRTASSTTLDEAGRIL